MDVTENWEHPKEILVILAHPDDPEFFLGGSIARWIKAGHRVGYVLFTKGDKGSDDPFLSSEKIANIRVKEQNAAACLLGVTSVEYLNYEDGYLLPSLEMRKVVVRAIRKYKPQILVTCDPENLFPSAQHINHPDHRNVGQVVVDAVFPATGNLFFFPELLEEGYPPHEVEEVWMSLTNNPNICLDVTEHWDDKMSALKKHASQIGDPHAFKQRMLDRLEIGEGEEFKYEERFRRIIFRRHTK